MKVNPDFLKLKREYSDESLLYFSEVGFYQHNVLRKWDRNIKVSISGNYEDCDIKSINEFILFFNSIVTTVQMEFSAKNSADIKILIEDSPVLGNYNGLTWKESPFYSSTIISAKIVIHSSFKCDKRRKLLFHEMLHAIGLSHSKMIFGKQNTMGVFIFNSIDEHEIFLNKKYKIPLLDSLAIKILYDKMMPIGMKKVDFVKGIKQTKIKNY
jgi:hypothetical protein